MISILCKLVGSVFILYSSLKLAGDINKTIENRYIQLQSLYSLLNSLKGEIMYMGEILPECFLTLSGKYKAPFNLWLKKMAEELMKEERFCFDKIWSENLTYLFSNSCLEFDDIELLTDLKDKLGSSDMDTQIKAIDYALLRIEEKRVGLKDELKEKRKAIMSISFFAGAVILIILL